MISPANKLVTNLHQRTLVNAGVLVRSLEFPQIIDIDDRLTFRLPVALTTIRVAST